MFFFVFLNYLNINSNQYDILLQINLRLILVSGKTSEFLFYITDSVATITQTVYEQWPSG